MVKKKAVRKKAVKKKTATRRRAPAAKVLNEDIEKQWQAEADVRTLAKAEEIKKDHSRMARAKAQAKKQVTEAQEVAKKIGGNTRTARKTRK